MPTRRVLCLIALLSSTGCSTAMLAEMSAEPTGCPAAKLEISEARQPWQGPRSWSATCTDGEASGEQKWFCSQLADEVFCSEDPR